MTSRLRKNPRQFGLFAPEPAATKAELPTTDQALEVLVELLLEAAGVTSATTTQGGGDQREDHR